MYNYLWNVVNNKIPEHRTVQMGIIAVTSGGKQEITFHTFPRANNICLEIEHKPRGLICSLSWAWKIITLESRRLPNNNKCNFVTRERDNRLFNRPIYYL